MSRLIVKNLPKNITEERLCQIFSVKGHITDCSLKYTKEGVFRKFAFIGYRNEEDCSSSINYFDNTYIDTSKIQVSQAFNFGDENKPRSWSRYSKDSSSYQNQSMKDKILPVKEKKDKDKKKRDKEEKMRDIIGDLYEDPDFLEFLETQKISGSGNKKVWSNDAIEELKKTYNSQMKTAKNSKTSNIVFDDSGNDSADENYQDMIKTDTDSEHHESVTHVNQEAEFQPVRHSVRVKGLIGRYHNVTLTEFFHPLKVKVVNIPQGPNHRRLGIAFVEFYSKEDVKEALKKHEGFINGHKVSVKKCKGNCDDDDDTSKPWERKNVQPDEEEEDLTESGRLFVRNLSYSCTEDDLEKLFRKYGNLTEIHLPVDSLTKRPKGFAFITYMIPENAVTAYSELDGSAFQGRMLHLLPSLMKKEAESSRTGRIKGSSYKLSKLQKQKEQASSSHNWNSLFLGANVVADLMAEKYEVDKSVILDPESRESLGVRMALGETQIVTETREFLIENGVCLDSFSQAAAPRSKNVILVKNLPASTKPSEICNVFSTYGTLGRVVLPPSGITAIVEFLSQSEAKKAFNNLAYTKFLHVPLYLEWAPVGAFTSPTQSKEKPTETNTTEENKNSKKENDDSSDGDSDIEPESVLFVKNLDFDTTETALREVFEQCGPVRNVIVARKKDLKNKGQMLSMGYGFVEYKQSQSAHEAMKKLQHIELDGHQLEIKISNRVSLQNKVEGHKKQEKKKQKTSKILVRNIPFQATKKEIKELFSVFGELKIVRLPKKLVGTGPHRGFGFVDFVSRHDAKRAFNALCHSTHLYGRRLVLEWAEAEQSIDELRKKTAEHFYEEIPKKKFKKASIMADLKGETDL